MIGQAQTGTGKTAAFGLPIMEYIDPSDPEVQALVLTPTRELCIQVTQALRTYGAHTGVDVVAVFGGAPIRTQQAQLRAGGHVVVGTVGRVLDLISRHSLVLHDCRFLVLDEADEMLDLGFLEDVEKILSLTPSSRQTALFSATMPPPIRKLADRYMYDPTIIQVEAATLTIDTVAQFQLPVETQGQGRQARRGAARRGARAGDRVRAHEDPRRPAVSHAASDRGMNVRALHGDMSQGSRDGVMLAFKGGRVPILVATDVAARGLDISTVTHVINYDVPDQPRHLRAPHRAHRARRALRARDHLRRGPPEARAGGDRTPHRHDDRQMGAGRRGRADARQRAPAPALQAAHLAPRRSGAVRQARARRRPRGRAARRRHRRARSPPRPASTARRCATCSCSTASPSCRCRPTRPIA